MIRRTLLAGILGAVAVLPATITAGGWAVITVEDLPDAVVAGKAIPLTFSVRQHGKTLIDGLQPGVQAILGNATVVAGATPAGSPGRYAALLVLPRPGNWTITINSGFGQSRVTLLPLPVLPSGSPAGPAAGARASVDRGRRLFVAKGCVTCHQDDPGSDNVSLAVGPRLVPQKYQAGFLARVLADPAATLPPSQQPVGSMPNLGLRPPEIESLVAFINAARVSAAR
jgi:mono/diheme cytochrome c family protein